jgi:hypothetical protein
MNNKIAFSLIVGMLMLGVGGTVVYDKFQPKTYYCQDTKAIMSCDSLSQYYNLPNGKCLNQKVGNKLCRGGWLEITNDFVVNDTQVGYGAKRYLCGFDGCVPLN